MTISGMNHFTVLTDDLERTVRFYTELLGLTLGPRPPLGFPGAWLYAGEQEPRAAVLHVIAGRDLPTERRGILDHMAFSARGLCDVVRRLEEANVSYTKKRVPETRMWQIFLFDPCGAKVELDFAAEESEE